MLSLAYEFLFRAGRFLFTGPEETALWTIAVQGRLAGSLVRESGVWRLTWFNGADRRLASFSGPVDGNLEALSAALSDRLGTPVELASLAV